MAAANNASTRTSWALAVGLIACAAGWWTWTREKLPETASVAKKTNAFVQIAGSGLGGGDRVLQEKADLFDPTPLFFPTEWNYGQRPLRLTLNRRESTQVFASIEPKYNFPEQGAKFYGSEPALVVEPLSDVLSQGNEVPLAGLGQVAIDRAPLPPRDGFIEVRRLDGREVVIAQVIEKLSLTRTDFAPVEFLMAVDASGLVGDPVLASGSGVEEVDLFFRNYLGKTFRIGERLAPGRYRVVIGA